MKYRLKKDLPWAKAGTIVESNDKSQYEFTILSQGGRRKCYTWWWNHHCNDDEWSDWFEEVDERWKPEIGRPYHWLTLDGERHRTTWYGNNSNKKDYEFGNCFRSDELALMADEQIKALLKEFHKNNP